MKENAAGGEKVWISIWEKELLLPDKSAGTVPAGNPEERTAKVLMTASLAESPAMMAAAALQSSNPRGAKARETAFPRQARRLSLPSKAGWSEGSKERRNQMAAEAANITVKAFFTKPAALEAAVAATTFMSGR